MIQRLFKKNWLFKKSRAPQQILYSIPFSIFEICHVILFQISLTGSTNHASGANSRGRGRRATAWRATVAWAGFLPSYLPGQLFGEKRKTIYSVGRFLSSIIGKSKITEGNSDAVGDSLNSLFQFLLDYYSKSIVELMCFKQLF